MCDWEKCAYDEGRDKIACHHRKEANARPKDSHEPINHAGGPGTKAAPD